MAEKRSHRRLVVLLVVFALVGGLLVTVCTTPLIDHLLEWESGRKRPVKELVMERGRTERWEMIEHGQALGPPFAFVELFNPGFGGDWGSDVTVLWDGEEVFCGRLPGNDSAERISGGFPTRLARIWTSPGDHTLEVIHSDGRHEKMDVHLNHGGRECFYLIGHIKGKPVLIEPLGPNPMFI
jgi:hypothetical protein